MTPLFLRMPFNKKINEQAEYYYNRILTGKNNYQNSSSCSVLTA